MQILNFDPNSFSKEKFIIGGISVYVYNSSVLAPYIDSFNNELKTINSKIEELPVNVLYLVHQREGNYKYTESIAYYILKGIYSEKHLQIPFICVTFDCRNHGQRLVDGKKNDDWKAGNSTHAIDMVSSIDGNVADIKLIMDYLPAYLNLESYLSDTAKKVHDTKIKFHNFLSGYSLGGHTVIRFANRYPELVEILNPVVGCNDLSSLLINRLFKSKIDSPDYDKKWFYFEYNEINMPDDYKQKYYPESFHKKLSQEDTSIFEQFPFSNIKLFACYGELDKLVPTKLSKLWTDLYCNSNPDSEIFIQKQVGHDATTEMHDKFIAWLLKFI